MSNRSGQGRQDNNNKGFTKTHNYNNFLPKNPNPTLSTSLRQTQPSIPATTSGVPNRGQNGNFVKYLPQDEAVAAGLGAEDGALDPLESQRVVDLLNTHLSRLLKFKPKQFWTQVAADASLHEFLDSFLQFRNRWYDFPHRGVKGIVAGVIVGERDLSRRVFMFFE
ncbi:uncharacterized protein LOC124843170 isoform X2 [Vigna umbellata]|uniref:uncharacterized protein LOC124843170 isoform X2 n=1 Tax=Vigna umbellata TaxID=87088 RepID=UPI001F5FE965|nr:uncharacterized protein LOC124843170 isoform X2 [Vigna umbellata]